MLNKQVAGIILLLTIIFIPAGGQKLINSPYSRFNIGALEPVATFKAQGMGGASAALRDISSVFYTNPASYSSFDTTSFIFDFGFDYGMNYMSDSKESYFSDDLNYDHLIMGFPIMKGWGVTAGVVPVSNGYYRIYNTVLNGDPDYDAITGPYTSLHAGEGSYNNFILGTGFKVFKNLSLGINMKVMFGTLERKYDVTFGDYFTTFHNNTVESSQISGINFDYGLQYTAVIKKDAFFNAGFSYTPGHEYNLNYSRFSYKSTGYGSVDTVTYVSDENEKAFIPAALRAGVAFGKINKFTVAFDYSSADWSELSMPGPGGYAADTRTYSLGLEYIPEKYSNFSFFRRVEYRAGAHFGDNYVFVEGEQVKELGASFGLGIPMGLSLTDKRSLSRTNFVFDYTRRYGSESGSLHTENIFTFGLSLNFYDFWFVKRKYD
ncbi:MAG: hypothetical protein MUD02_04515 [Bacteroidales bacterium]|jgi:hypothetical protein|nr:hypothetical protein [Bacteroidales bacterium]MCU0408194.1 hypothetical protein [Bacteroidales bacterium]